MPTSNRRFTLYIFSDVAALQDRLQRMESLLHELAHKAPGGNASRGLESSDNPNTPPDEDRGERVVEGLNTLSLPPSPASASSYSPHRRFPSVSRSTPSENGSTGDNRAHRITSEGEGDDASSLSSDDNDLADHDPASRLRDQLRGMTIQDYDSIKYMGSSAGLHFINRHILSSGPIMIPGKNGFILQKLNDTDEELVILNYQVKDESTGTVALDAWPPKELMDRLIDLCVSCNSLYMIFAAFPAPKSPWLILLHIFAALTLASRYFLKVHPRMPIIHKQQFLRQYNQKITPLPPLLLISVYAVASRFITDKPADVLDKNESITKDGKKSTASELGALFYERAERLLETERRRSRISTVQSLLLLAMYFNETKDDEESRHW
ncbi:hypothetical protein BC936DRAFT_141783 [Jimgerdemannia flammicorona]|uniref:Xylanolytic transcriptional activator regulatory domain-containing protein n=1 Tax=Jimgerdemannia flammicorona TaxID=994334 RepID=A0A433DMJ3_9FUNG|nr:hypothetical protein BC936DRAFT_141783 [Jimgerdemannia flammicorona]